MLNGVRGRPPPPGRGGRVGGDRGRFGRSDRATHHPQVVSATHEAQLVWYSQPAAEWAEGGVMEASAKKARRRGRRGWRGCRRSTRAIERGARGAFDRRAGRATRIASLVARTRTAHAHRRGAQRRDHQQDVGSHTSPHRPTTRARRCGRAREKTAKRAGVETRRAVRRRRSRSLRAGFPCASRGVDERSRACGPSRTYARGCDRRGGGGCQRNESRARCQRGIFGFLFFEIVRLGSCAFQSYISCGIEKRQHGSVRKR